MLSIFLFFSISYNFRGLVVVFPSGVPASFKGGVTMTMCTK